MSLHWEAFWGHTGLGRRHREIAQTKSSLGFLAMEVLIRDAAQRQRRPDPVLLALVLTGLGFGARLASRSPREGPSLLAHDGDPGEASGGSSGAGTGPCTEPWGFHLPPTAGNPWLEGTTAVGWDCDPNARAWGRWDPQSSVASPRGVTPL